MIHIVPNGDSCSLIMSIKCNLLSAPADVCPKCGVIVAKLEQAKGRKQHPEQPSQAISVGKLPMHIKEGESSHILGTKTVFLALLATYCFKLFT